MSAGLTGRRAWVAGVAGTCLGVGLLAPFDVLTASESAALGITLFALVAWTAQPVPVEWTSLAVLLALPATGLLDFGQTFAPFAGPTIWLVFAGMTVSLVVSESGLGARLASSAVPLLAAGPLRLLVGLHILGLLAAFLVPSGVVRVLLLMPVGIALARQLDPEGRDPQLPAVVSLCVVFGTYFCGAGILTGTVPNLVVAGQLEAHTGRVVYWGEWLRWMFPVLGLVRAGLSIAVIWFLWGRHLRPLPAAGPTGPAREPWSASQVRSLVLLVAGVGLWATDVVHGMAPVYVGLGLVLAAVTPGAGTLKPGQLRQVDFPFFLYLTALFGIGAALDGTGFNDRMVTYMVGVLQQAGATWLGPHLLLTAAAVPLDFLMDIAAVGAVVTPSLIDVGSAAGLDPLASAFSVAMATTVAFLPYQSAPFMVVLGYGTLGSRQLATAMLVMSTVSLLLLSPLNVLYWRWTGLQ